LVKAMKKVQGQSTSCASSISQAAAEAALLGPQDCVEEMRIAFEERYNYILGALNELPGVECPECDGAFYAFPSFQGFIDGMDDVASDMELAGWFLEEAGVAMVPGSAFGAPGHLRLSYASSMEELEDAIGRMKRAMNSYSNAA
jgi:aspartate aminotransferase